MLERALPGAAHRDLVAAYRESAVRSEAIPTHVNIRFGPDSGLPFLRPSGVTLKDGELISWDVGLVLDQYHADTARCASIGAPADERGARYYAALVAGQQAAIAAIEPGVAAATLHERAIETVRAEGIPHYERIHSGHGIGLATYDDPLLAPGSDAAIEPGMVLCVETPYYELGLGSPIVEDTVLVTGDGVEYLTHHPRDLVAL
jgi:Xaa-Pro aminopeptidase